MPNSYLGTSKKNHPIDFDTPLQPNNHSRSIRTLDIYENQDIKVITEGEIYDWGSITGTRWKTISSTASQIAMLYQVGQLETFLADVDGVFSLQIYDKQNQEIYLINDRFGYCPVYFAKENKTFYWSNQVTLIVQAAHTQFTLDERVLSCFLELGHVIGDHTFFREIKSLPPATILTFSVESLTISTKHYWTWAKVQPLDISFKEAVRKCRDYFLQSIERRFDHNERIGVSLSGGMDSRLIFAALHELYPSYTGIAYTFGSSNSIDVVLAKSVVEKSHWKHSVYSLATPDKLFQKRLPALKYTDGMKSIFHLHTSDCLPYLTEQVDVNLDGFIGGTVMGGHFQVPTNRHKTLSLANHFFGEHGALAPNELEYYNNFPIAYFINNRARRYTNAGVLGGALYVKQRRPFVDNDLLTFLVSLPADYLKHYRLFAETANYFPRFFKDIPWQMTNRTGLWNRWPLLRFSRKIYSLERKRLGQKNNSAFFSYEHIHRAPAFLQSINHYLASGWLRNQPMWETLDEEIKKQLKFPGPNPEATSRVVTLLCYLESLSPEKKSKNGSPGINPF